jgi:hypothetical protein
MIDYGRVAWSITKKKFDNDGSRKQVLLKEFQATWCRHKVFATLVDGRPKWILVGEFRG